MNSGFKNKEEKLHYHIIPKINHLVRKTITQKKEKKVKIFRTQIWNVGERDLNIICGNYKKIFEIQLKKYDALYFCSRNSREKSLWKTTQKI